MPAASDFKARELKVDYRLPRLQRRNVMFLRKVGLFQIFLVVATLTTSPAFCAPYSGWVKGETCWVVKEPSIESRIVGIIVQKASVKVDDVGEGWLKIIFAPVRDPETGKFIDCSGCYIQKKDVTTVIPGKW
jgi:hypothetical protein